MHRNIRGIVGALGFMVFAALGCTPEPKSLPCTNDSECKKHDERLNYCLESRCVECVGMTSCPGGKSCDDGACVQCVNDQGCPRGNHCIEGSCEAS